MDTDNERISVLVTRPEQQAGPLGQLLLDAGYSVIRYPVLEIDDPSDGFSRTAIRNSIGEYDIAVFISPTAVDRTLGHIQVEELPDRIFGIGSATSRALRERGATVCFEPEGADSESLLQQPELSSEAVRGRNIVIFKGEGGRSLLREALVNRGANVFEANMYRRRIPSTYVELEASMLEEIDILLLSSGEAIHNLLAMTRDKDTLLMKPIIVPGERCSNIASDLGFTDIIITGSATNQSFIDTLSAR